jgi:hypothetical protein
MIKTPIWLPLLLASIFGASDATAYVNEPEVFPPNPIAGHTVSIRVDAGYCDGFVGNPEDVVSVTGQVAKSRYC